MEQVQEFTIEVMAMLCQTSKDNRQTKLNAIYTSMPLSRFYYNVYASTHNYSCNPHLKPNL